MVYVDNFDMPYSGMLMSHMVADTTKELLEMATRIGVNHRWIQYPNTDKEHFDICISKKKLAIRYGAVLMDARELAVLRSKKKSKP